MQTHCSNCAAVLEPSKPGRPRKYCRTCAPPYPRGKPEPPPPTSDEPGRVEVAVAAEVARANAEGSVLAALALTLARRLDLGTDSGTGLAALAKSIRSLIEAIGHEAPSDSLVAQLRESRDRKRRRTGPRS